MPYPRFPVLQAPCSSQRPLVLSVSRICFLRYSGHVYICLLHMHRSVWGFPGGTEVKNLTANGGNTEDAGSIPGSGRSPGGGNSNPLQYSCLENPMDRRACRATDHRVAMSWIRLRD